AIPSWLAEGFGGSDEPAYLAAWLAGATPKAVVSYVDTLRHAAVAPRVVESLVLAVGRLPAHSAAQWAVHSALLGLSGADLPPDGDQWRSWWVGHRLDLLGRAALRYAP